MMKDIFRGVGIGCILAGGILYFTNNDSNSSVADQYETELNELQSELDKVKKELAVAQTLTSSKSGTTPSQSSDAAEEKAETKQGAEAASKPVT